jgi:hypothetical protein
MPQKVGPITFNCRQRLRKHRGVERNFDAVAMAAVVNSPAVQERVAKGDMLGYYGHFPRVMFGMEPGEAGIHNGKMILLDAAICTTKLEAAADGTITHEAEFLDTAAGEKAWALHQSKKGGFSSAISCKSVGGNSVPHTFHAFDYVWEPNFSGNRGYCLDGVLDGTDEDGFPGAPGAVFDSVAGGAQGMGLVRMFDSMYATLQADHDMVLKNMQRVAAENEELLSMLSRRPEEVQRAAKLALATLDSAGVLRKDTRPLVPRAARVDLDSSELGRIARAFDSVADLPKVEAPAVPGAAAPGASAVMRAGRAMLRELGVKV